MVEPRSQPHRCVVRLHTTMRTNTMKLAGVIALLLACCRSTQAYSSLAGSCEHAGVIHGMDRIEKQEGTGGYTLRLGNPGVNVPGATVPVVVEGTVPFKGLLVFAMDQKETKPLGSWSSDQMPDGCQVHPHCSYAATHDSYHNIGAVSNALPWIAPGDLQAGQVVKFKVTVVRDYETWFAFETTFGVGSALGGGEAGLKILPPSGAPGSKGLAPGTRAPSMGAAVEGGWRAPDGTTAPVTKPVVSKPKPSLETGGGGRKAGAPDVVGGEKNVNAGGGFLDASLVKAKRRTARIAHGLVMGLAWLVFAPSAALVSRHGRRAPWWFSFHRNVNAVVAVATFGSAVFILSERGWSTPWGKHGKVGALVCALVAIQAVGGYLRKSFPRASWSKLHKLTGVALLIGGAYNCLLGAKMIGWMESGMKKAYALTCAAIATCVMLAAVMEAQKKRESVAAKLERKV